MVQVIVGIFWIIIIVLMCKKIKDIIHYYVSKKSYDDKLRSNANAPKALVS